MKFWHTVYIGIKLMLNGLVTALALWFINFIIILLGFTSGFLGMFQASNNPLFWVGIFIAIIVIILQFWISGFIGNKILKLK